MTFNRWVVALLITSVVVATGCAADTGTAQNAPLTQQGNEKPAKFTYSTMNPQQLQSEIDAGEKLVIVDLREPELYRAGHITGAQNVPFEEFDKRMNELNPETKIVLVCHTGPMGDASGSLLAERGYGQVRNLAGGMAAWRGKLVR
ncbi:MAG: rhodanese-like domain-containing protein [Chloroflexi bacterium]|nr:rhodanese-like domain-containing protein [Chloroflexota bacterium]